MLGVTKTLPPFQETPNPDVRAGYPILGLRDAMQSWRHIRTEIGWMNFTHEQEPAIHSLARIVKLVAFAGTGKTTTLVGYAKARPQCRLLYLCYNKSVEVAAKQKFPPNVTCKTAHGLAYASIGSKYKLWWSTHSGHGFEFFFSFGRSQSIVELMGPEPVVVAHQVLTNISLSLLPSQVARGRYPL